VLSASFKRRRPESPLPWPRHVPIDPARSNATGRLRTTDGPVTRQPLRLIGYVRVSTAEQARSGLGAAAQRAKITEAVARDGHQLVEVIADDASTGPASSGPACTVRWPPSPRTRELARPRHNEPIARFRDWQRLAAASPYVR
jgi:hypothetical protein